MSGARGDDTLFNVLVVDVIPDDAGNHADGKRNKDNRHVYHLLSSGLMRSKRGNLHRRDYIRRFSAVQEKLTVKFLE